MAKAKKDEKLVDEIVDIIMNSSRERPVLSTRTQNFNLWCRYHVAAMSGLLASGYQNVEDLPSEASSIANAMMRETEKQWKLRDEKVKGGAKKAG